MSEVVSNASPLIVLAKADLLGILPALFSGSDSVVAAVEKGLQQAS